MINEQQTTVLIVDDDPMFLLLLRKFCEHHNYHVVQASDGETAIAAYTLHQPSCILLDVKMPVMDGFAACRNIRALPKGGSVPIIMMTIEASDSIVDQCYDVGGSDYINKPIHWPVLRNRMDNLIARTHAENKNKENEEKLYLIAKLSARVTGDDFFQALVAATAQALGVNIAFVAELLPDNPTVAHTLALWIGKNKAKNIEYALAGTPCEKILEGKTLGFSQNLQDAFPADTWLKKVGAESYVGIPIQDNEGYTIGHIGIMDDKPLVEQQQIINTMRIFADRAAAELKQQRSNATLNKLSQALEQAGESILITNKDGMIEYINPAFTKISGYSKHDAIGQTPRLLNSGNQNKAFYKKMWQTVAAGNVWQGKVVDKKKDGSFYPAMLTIAPIINAAGEITHFVGSHADLSELEKMEKQFHQSQKMEAIGTLVGGVAHDFNNMLAGITGNIFLAKQESQYHPSMLTMLNNIEIIAFRAAEMIKQLLTFARKDRVLMQPLQFTSFIKEAMRLLHGSIPANITVKQEICTEMLEIKGDRTLLHQVMMNLINNACDAVDHSDAPCISLVLEAFTPSTAFLKHHIYFNAIPYARLTISDNGCGIAKDHREHVFEPFFTTKEQGKGTGLGLSMVFGAIKTHGGFVELESTKAKGATFHLYFPLIAQEKTVESLPQEEKNHVPQNDKLILIADDEPMVRDTVAKVLASMHYTVLTACDGLEALTIFKKHHDTIHLVVLDVVMPHLGGMALATKIRAINADVPVIFLTGYDRDHVLDGNAPLVNSDLLSKPVNFGVLNRCMRRLIDAEALTA